MAMGCVVQSTQMDHPDLELTRQDLEVVSSHLSSFMDPAPIVGPRSSLVIASTCWGSIEISDVGTAPQGMSISLAGVAGTPIADTC